MLSTAVSLLITKAYRHTTRTQRGLRRYQKRRHWYSRRLRPRRFWYLRLNRLVRPSSVLWVFRRKAIPYPKQLFARSVLARFRHPVVLSFIKKNFFFSAPVNRANALLVVSTGHLEDFAHSTKKKKTYLAGSLGFQTLIKGVDAMLRICSYRLKVRGKLAAKRGVFFAMRNFDIRLFSYRENSTVVHNGTRRPSPRRL